jgi:phosphomannomutase
LKNLAREPGVEDRYVEHLVASLDVEAIRSRKFRIAVDFCNGACGAIAARFLDALGCRLLPVNEEPTGEFAHPPSPTPNNMRQLATLLRCFEVDLGAAVNVDGDRIGFVTEEGVALSEEYALPLAAANRLARRPGPVVTNFSTSAMIEALAADYGQAVIRTPVGESHVVDQGLAEGAVLVGEGSGGVAALPSTMTFDALATLGMVLEQLATSDGSLTRLAARLPHFVMRKHEIPCPPNLVYRILDRFRLHYPDHSPECTDGLRLASGESWLHIRASGTEPLLRIIAEARSAERVDALVSEAVSLARRFMYGHGIL